VKDYALLAVADGFNPRGKFGSGSRDRVRAMILLLRYSGLRISDASMLERRRLSGDKLFLYIQKTGTRVWVPLPPQAVEARHVCSRTPAEGRPDRARFRSSRTLLVKGDREALLALGESTAGTA